MILNLNCCQISATGAKVMFIEVTNEDRRFLDHQYSSVSRTSFDYKGVAHSISVS